MMISDHSTYIGVMIQALHLDSELIFSVLSIPDLDSDRLKNGIVTSLKGRAKRGGKTAAKIPFAVRGVIHGGPSG